MAHYLLVHGAWGGAWYWRDTLHTLIRADHHHARGDTAGDPRPDDRTRRDRRRLSDPSCPRRPCPARAARGGGDC